MKKNNRSRFSYFINPGENSTGGGHLDTIAEKTELVELTEEEKKIIDERLEAYHSRVGWIK